jgi:hypothetical protein
MAINAGFGKVLNYKLVLLGDSAVGKSSVVERFVKNEFYQYQNPTIGSSSPTGQTAFFYICTSVACTVYAYQVSHTYASCTCRVV